MRSAFFTTAARQGKAILSLPLRFNGRTTFRPSLAELSVWQEIGKPGLLESVDCKLTAIESEQNVSPSGSTTSGAYLSSIKQAKGLQVTPATCNVGGDLWQTGAIRSGNITHHSCFGHHFHSAVSKRFYFKDIILNRQFNRHEHHISNEWLAARLMADRKRRQSKAKRLQARSNSGVQDQSTVFTPADELGAAPRLSQPPPSQPLRGSLEPTSEGEEKLAPVMARPDLLVTRNIEWANLAFGFEQQNRYVIIDPRQPHAPVGYILEESAWFMRQLLRTRRSFVASVLDGSGAEVFRVRRPMWLINSAIYVEVDGKVVGEAHRRWHLWRRIYDLYLGNKQFATVENPGFWYWTFTLKNRDGGTVAEIDRNWRGFGFEFFTDAGQYVIRFGDVTEGVQEAQMYTNLSPGQQIVRTPTGQPGVAVQTADTQVEPLVVDRPLNLLERAVALALAVSLDNDYFSRHSGSFGGFHMPIFGSGDLAGTGGEGIGGEEPGVTPDRSSPGITPDVQSAGGTLGSHESDWKDSSDEQTFGEVGESDAQKSEDQSLFGDAFGGIFGGGGDDAEGGGWGGDWGGSGE